MALQVVTFCTLEKNAYNMTIICDIKGKACEKSDSI